LLNIFGVGKVKMKNFLKEKQMFNLSFVESTVVFDPGVQKVSKNVGDNSKF
jgi:hypothetical protein